jgi:hypothetical protein
VYVLACPKTFLQPSHFYAFVFLVTHTQVLQILLHTIHYLALGLPFFLFFSGCTALFFYGFLIFSDKFSREIYGATEN